MQNEFLNRFYSSRQIVNISELRNTKQLDKEPVIYYINCWRALSLKYKDYLPECSTFEICDQGMD